MKKCPVRAPDPLQGLSPRQREILTLVAKGLTNDEIGELLSISPGTVRTHVTAVLSQLGVTNRTEAAAMFVSSEAGIERVAAVLARPAVVVGSIAAASADERSGSLAAGLTADLHSLFSRSGASSWTGPCVPTRAAGA
jgi:DNA-binding CsgD family transcriptional regulator